MRRAPEAATMPPGAARGSRMATEEEIQVVLEHVTSVESCGSCGMTLRFGIYECAHCGEDLEDVLRDWAQRLLTALASEKD